MLGKSADDLNKEVVTSIDKSRSVSGINCSYNQLFVIRNLLGDDLVNLDAFFLVKFLGSTLLSVPKNAHSERVHPVVKAHLRFHGCLKGLTPGGVRCIIVVINVILQNKCKSVVGRVTFLLFFCESRSPPNTVTLTPFSMRAPLTLVIGNSYRLSG